ncbi:MAG: hypothetical protein ABI867_03015 [Kofleriaceae bacterium]
MRIRGTELAIGDRPAIVLPVVVAAHYRLLAPLAIDPGQVVVAIHQTGLLTLLAFDASGRELARIDGPIDWWPNQVSHGAAGYWVHDDDRHLLLGTSTLVGGRPYMRQGDPVVQRWLLAIDRELVWISLDTAERRAFEWTGEERAVVRGEHELWCTTPHGLWRLDAGEPPVRVWAGDPQGVATAPSHAWLGVVGSTIVEIELATGRETWRTKLAHEAYAVQRFANGILANGLSRFTYLASDGRILATTDQRRDVGVAQLADGTVAVSAGEQIAIIDPFGTARTALPMPYDGQILGATADRFVFGPVSGGVDRVRPTALVAFDRTGRITARLTPPYRPVHVDATRVYVLDHVTHNLLAWDPRGSDIGITPPPPRVPTERGATRIGPEVYNTRDDWPEVGIEVRADFLALDGTYGGSLGHGNEAAMRVSDAAIATFARCDLTVGGNGSVAERASTIFLIDCKLPAAVWRIGSACHLAILGGQVGGDALCIHAAPTATVTVDGLIVRRAGAVYLVTNTVRGSEIVVDGRTYSWEKDDRSGGIGYGSRGKFVSYAHLTDSDGASISFELLDGDRQLPGWWRGRPELTPAVLERAIRIATREHSQTLTEHQVIEAFEGSVWTLQDELAAAGIALAALADHTASFVRGMLAVGCSRADQDRVAIDDWVASHADDLRAARTALQRLLDETHAFENRSAIAFLIDMTTQLHVDLALDLTASDEQMRDHRCAGSRPWGIPASHWWWEQGDAPDPTDPRFR